MTWFFERSEPRLPDLKAARLALVPITVDMMAAETASDGFTRLGKLLRARVTAEWPPVHWEPHVFQFITKQLVEQPETAGYHRYVVLRDDLGWGRTLIGCVGGFPKTAGDVELGYSTLPAFQRRGYATLAAGTLVNWLLGKAAVRSVSAQTYPALPESIKVMERCGMGYAGTGDEAGTLRYRRIKG